MARRSSRGYHKELTYSKSKADFFLKVSLAFVAIRTPYSTISA